MLPRPLAEIDVSATNPTTSLVPAALAFAVLAWPFPNTYTAWPMTIAPPSAFVHWDFVYAVEAAAEPAVTRPYVSTVTDPYVPGVAIPEAKSRAGSPATPAGFVTVIRPDEAVAMDRFVKVSAAVSTTRPAVESRAARAVRVASEGWPPTSDAA